MFQLSEKITLSDSGRRTTTDGYMTVDGRVARTGIQKYTGRELGLMDRDFVNVYRPEDEVMNEASMFSFAHKPITDDHPPELVTSDNWQKYAKGMTGERVARDGESIVVPLGLMDAATIANIDGGKQELSAGYTCRLEFVDGVTPDGEKYNAIQRDIRVNHIAVVQKGRAGPSCRLGDASLKPKEVQMTLQTISFDGLSVEVTNQGAQVINALQGRLETSDKALATANTAHTAAIALKDKELGEKDAEIKKLTDAALTPEAIDALVVDRAAVITKAKTFGDVDTTGKTNAEIRKAAVTLKVGDAKLVGKSDEYVEALFDTFAADADPVKSKLQNNSGKTKVGDAKLGEDDRVSAYDEYLASLNPTDAKEGA